MSTRIFLSYVYEDHAYRDQVIDWYRRGLLGAFEPVFETQDVRQGGEDAVRRHLRPIMRNADAILVLVGQDAHDRRWIDEEVHYCASAGKAIFVMQLPNATGAAPREVRGYPTIPFSAADLRAAFESKLRAWGR